MRLNDIARPADDAAIHAQVVAPRVGALVRVRPHRVVAVALAAAPVVNDGGSHFGR